MSYIHHRPQQRADARLRLSGGRVVWGRSALDGEVEFRGDGPGGPDRLAQGRRSAGRPCGRPQATAAPVRSSAAGLHLNRGTR